METKDVNEVLRQDVLASDRLSDYFYALLKEKIDETAADDIKEFMADFVIRQSKASELVDELDLEHIRVCSECGKPMYEGYCVDNGAEYYCFDECLQKNMTQEEFDALYDDGRGDSYWTSWID